MEPQRRTQNPRCASDVCFCRPGRQSSGLISLALAVILRFRSLDGVVFEERRAAVSGKKRIAIRISKLGRTRRQQAKCCEEFLGATTTVLG